MTAHEFAELLLLIVLLYHLDFIVFSFQYQAKVLVGKIYQVGCKTLAQ